jgi:TP901 family phage tail tape measure protein
VPPVRSVLVRLDALVTPYIASMGKASAATAGFARTTNAQMAATTATTSKLGQTAGLLPTKFGALAAVGGAAFAGIGLAAAGAVSRFADFEVAMDAVAASTGATDAEIEKLGATALEAAANTKFGAVEAARGIEALGKAGVTTSDIIGGGLKGSLDLAAAGEIEVAEAAELAAGAMTQFGLSGRDVPHIADLMAAAAGKAQGSVSDMALAFKQSGLVASQMGLSVEETTGTLAAFASNALIGSDAGTSFRTMLLRLANPSGEARDLMASLGIAAYDAQGNFVGMANLAGQLKGQLSGLAPAQRDAAMATIFGSDAIRAANVLYQQGASGVVDWTEKVNDSGFAADQAAERTDNLRGDLERLGGTLESVAIEKGGALNEFFRGAVQELDHMVQSTDQALTEEAEIWRRSAAVWDLSVTPSIENAEAAFGEFTNRIAAAHDPMRAAEADTARLTAAGEYYAAQADQSASSTSALVEQTKELQDAAFEASEQFLAGRDHLRDWNQAVLDANEAIGADGFVASVDLATQAGIDNTEKLDDMAAAAQGVLKDMVEAGENTDVASRQMRVTLIATGKRFGMTKAEAEDYADQVIATAKLKINTPVAVNDTAARAKLAAWKKTVAEGGGTITFSINAIEAANRGGLGGFFTSGSRRPGGFPWLGSYRQTQGPHDGGALDYGVPSGTPLRATFPGYLDVTNLGNRSYGMYYTLRGGNKYELAAHLSGFARSDGYVSTGSLIGWSGDSGNSTGPHVHLLRNFHTGGWTPGGPINTLPGEFVINAGSAAANRSLIQAINTRGGDGNGVGPMRLHRDDIRAIGLVIAGEMSASLGASSYATSRRADLYSRTS